MLFSFLTCFEWPVAFFGTCVKCRRVAKVFVQCSYSVTLKCLKCSLLPCIFVIFWWLWMLVRVNQDCCLLVSNQPTWADCFPAWYIVAKQQLSWPTPRMSVGLCHMPLWCLLSSTFWECEVDVSWFKVCERQRFEADGSATQFSLFINMFVMFIIFSSLSYYYHVTNYPHCFAVIGQSIIMGQDVSKLSFHCSYAHCDCRELDVKLQFHPFLRIAFIRLHYPNKPIWMLLAKLQSLWKVCLSMTQWERVDCAECERPCCQYTVTYTVHWLMPIWGAHDCMLIKHTHLRSPLSSGWELSI